MVVCNSWGYTIAVGERHVSAYLFRYMRDFRPFVVRTISIGSSLAMSVVISRYLGPSVAGSFFLLYTLATVASTIGRFGTDNLALRVAVDGPSARASVRQLYLITMSVSAVLTLVLASVVVFLPGQITSNLPPLAVWAGIISISPMAWSVLAGAVLKARGWIAAGILAELGSVPVVTTIILGVSWEYSWTLASVTAVLAASAWLTCLWSVPLSIVLMRSASEPVTDRTSVLRTNLGSLSSMMGTSVLYYLLVWAPLLILGFASSTTEVALYNAAARISALLTLIPNIQASYLAPRYAVLHLAGDHRAISRLSGIASQRGLIAAALCGIPILFFSDEVLTLFGDQFSSASPSLRILTVAALLVAMIGPVNPLLINCGQEKFALALSLTLVVFWVVVGPPAAEIGAAVGVALVALIANVGYSAASSTWLVTRREISSSRVTRALGKARVP